VSITLFINFTNYIAKDCAIYYSLSILILTYYINIKDFPAKSYRALISSREYNNSAISLVLNIFIEARCNIRLFNTVTLSIELIYNNNKITMLSISIAYI
jgi:hypothetical protein